jgi:hypothetical protein
MGGLTTLRLISRLDHTVPAGNMRRDHKRAKSCWEGFRCGTVRYRPQVKCHLQHDQVRIRDHGTRG